MAFLFYEQLYYKVDFYTNSINRPLGGSALLSAWGLLTGDGVTANGGLAACQGPAW